MAKQTVTADGRSEEEYRADINRAIADTEDEIFREAMSDQELDNDGDDSLEQMADSPLDEEVEDDEEGEEPEAEAAAGEEPEEEEEPAEDEEPAEEEEPVEEPPREPRRGIPSGRLQEEAERRRQAEERAIASERELALMRGRYEELSARQQPAPQPQQPPPRPPKPDRYTDEAAYDQWMLDEGRRLAREDMRAELAADRAQQQQVMAQRVEASFGAAANSERRIEFLDAYDRLTHLDPRDPNNRLIVQSITSSHDPASALFEWFGGYQSQYEPQPRQRAARHETRLPTRPPVRGGPPSLNSVGGGGPGQRVDPEMYDDSDAAVFRYATR